MQRLASLSLPRWAAWLREAGATVVGVACGLLALRAASAGGLAAGVVTLVAAAVATVARALRARLLPLVWIAIAAGTAAGVAILRTKGVH